MPSFADWVAGGAAALVVIICVLVHFEGLRLITDRIPHPKWHPRRRIVVLIFAMLFLHVLEVWIFAGAYWYFLENGGYGELAGVSDRLFIDCLYFSAVVFSTVGFGDLYPTGPLRVIAGVEAVTGLTLITWSASFTFVEMLKTWRPQSD
jgi:Ion channel